MGGPLTQRRGPGTGLGCTRPTAATAAFRLAASRTPRQITASPKSDRAQRATPLSVGATWAVPAGRYVIRARAKLEDSNTPPHPQTVNFDLYIYDPPNVTHNYYGTPDLGYPPERTLIPTGLPLLMNCLRTTAVQLDQCLRGAEARTGRHAVSAGSYHH